MRAAVAVTPAVLDSRTINITTSVGGAAAADANFEHLVSAADVALYRAKNQGRNRVAWDQGGRAACVGV